MSVLGADLDRTLARLALALAALSLAPAPARAWTRTEVVGMSARAEVSASGAARVSLEIVVDVRGGWVERFELNELGPHAALDPGKPPTWIAADGTKHVPQRAQLEDGRLTLDFGRADERGRGDMPRRGTYKSRVVYETLLARGSEPREHLMSLPAWPNALENVELWIDAPAGSELYGSRDAELEQRTRYERGVLDALHIVRPTLPRARVLEARIVLPERAQRTLQASAPHEKAALPSSASREAIALALLAFLLLALKRIALAAPEPARAARRRAAVGAGIALACGTACTLFGWAYPARPGVALSALALAVTVALAAPVRSAAAARAITFRPAHALDVLRAKRIGWLRSLGPSSWLDARTPCGALLLALLAAGAWSLGQSDAALLYLEALLVLSPLWLVRAPLSVAEHTARDLLALARLHAPLAAVAHAHGVGLALEVACESTCGYARAARLRIGSLMLIRRGQTLVWQAPDGSLSLAFDPPAELQAKLSAAESNDRLSQAA